MVDGKHDESFKCGAPSAGAVMAFDGQTESHSLPSDPIAKDPVPVNYRSSELCQSLNLHFEPREGETVWRVL